jgi:hypothetical protein
MLGAQKWKPSVLTVADLWTIAGADAGYTWLCRVQQDTVTNPQQVTEDVWQWISTNDQTINKGWTWYSSQEDFVTHLELENTMGQVVSNVT